ncbi:MAG: CBS domain-containing protein [Dehalococcoidia bacterium]|nr:CBS domain-containing protein [Dehalococcoidia bacterium]
MFIRQCMRTPVITTTPNTPIHMAQTMMRDNRIHHLPVVDGNGKLIGMLTDARLRESIASLGSSQSGRHSGDSISTTTVQKVMASDVVTILPDAYVSQAASVGRKHRVGALPVVDGSGKMIGIITTTDLIRLFEEIMRPREHGANLYFESETKQEDLPDIIQVLNSHHARIVTLMTVPPGREVEKLFAVHVEASDLAAIGDALRKQGYKFNLVPDKL